MDTAPAIINRSQTDDLTLCQWDSGQLPTGHAQDVLYAREFAPGELRSRRQPTAIPSQYSAYPVL